MIADLFSPHPPISNFQEEDFTCYETNDNVLVFTHLTEVT